MATRDRNNNNVDSSDQDGKRRSLFTSITPNSADLDGRRGSRQIHVISNWTTFDEQPLSGESIAELFSNTIPAVRYPKLFSTEECAKLVDIIKTAHVVGSFTYLKIHENLARSRLNLLRKIPIIQTDEENGQSQTIPKVYYCSVVLHQQVLLLRTLKLLALSLLIALAQGTYNQKVIFPPVGTVGISQFDYPNSASAPFRMFPSSHGPSGLTQ